jgi:molecular chaperone HtpG
MAKKKTQKFEFKAEMRQLLHLIINSLYTNPEVFIRELVSNSSDAINKVRFMQLTGKKLQSEKLPLQIKIEIDEKNQTFSIEDTGVGMTLEDLTEKLGTVASSGTGEFIRQLKESKEKIDGNMIGQFGVGFYSAFMVTDEITVETKHADPDGKAYKWVSDGQGTFEIEEIDRTERGTKISFKLKDEHKEFAQEYRVKQIIKKYSNFVDYPILLGKDEINSRGALWQKQKNEIKEEELNEFYKFVANDFEDPLDHLHLAMEGRMNFKALLFVPSKAKPNFFRTDDFRSVQLYSNKVFVQDDCKELLPEYLRFIEGVVDSEDLPLNVSREVTQYTPVMNKIKDVLTNKILGMIEYWLESEPEKFKTFYKEFGPLFKSGLNSDFTNRERIIEMLRFQTTKSADDEFVSLKEYTERMPDFQKEIYYISGDNLKDLRRNAKLEYFRKKDVEVILLADPVDAFVVPGIFEYKEKPLKSIEKSDIELGKDDEKTENTVDKSDLDQLISTIKEVVGDSVEDVVASKRLVDSAATLTIGKEGMDSHMERMMKMMDQNAAPSKRLFEINPNHPLIVNLVRIQKTGATDKVKLLSRQLYESTLLLEGTLESPGDFVSRMTEVLTMASE